MNKKTELYQLNKDSTGGRITYTRKQRGIAQTDLATKVGITKSMLSKYENDINIPKADVLARIALQLNVTTDYLLGLTKSERYTPSEDGNWIFLTPYEKTMVEGIKLLTKKQKVRLHERMMYFQELNTASHKPK